MGGSSSGCNKSDGEKQSHLQGRQKRRIWWLKHSPFGPEPKHDKRLSWLKQDVDLRDDFKRNQALDELNIDENDQIRESSREAEDDSLDDLGTNASSNAPLSVRHYHSHSLQHLSAPSSSTNRNLNPQVQVLANFPIPPVSWHGVKTLEDLDNRTNSDGVIRRKEYVSSIKRSHSATFFQGTRFSSIRRSARNFVIDLDEFRKEMSNPEVAKSNSEQLSPRLFEFRTNVLKVSPSKTQIKPQDFINGFLPILEKEPECFKSLLTLDFDVFDISNLPEPFDAMPLVTTALVVLIRLNVLERLEISWLPFIKFLINVEEGYNFLPYHSKWHAADVVGNLGYFLARGWFRKVLNPVHVLTSILAAAAHDVDHNGQTNQFHRLAKTPIGVSYPESNLEYHHIAKAMGIRNLSGCDWPAEVASKDKTFSIDEIWTLFVTLILRTDPAMHDPEQKPFASLSQGTAEEQNQAQPPALMEILHFADISNSVKPTKIAKKWAKRFYREFVNLGIEARKLKLNIPIFKDAKKMPSLPDTQIFFISNICLPSFRDLCVFMPEASETVINLETNLAYWKDQKDKLLELPALSPVVLPGNLSGQDELVLPASIENSPNFSKKSSEPGVSTSNISKVNASNRKQEASTKEASQPDYCQLPSTPNKKTVGDSREQKEWSDLESKDDEKLNNGVIPDKGAPKLSTGNKEVKNVGNSISKKVEKSLNGKDTEAFGNNEPNSYSKV